jgi:uncharacterized protein
MVSQASRGRPALATWQPSADDVRRVFAEQNPWHLGVGVPNVLAPPSERPLAQHLWRCVMTNEPRRFHIVLGPRRVGKTTAMYQTARHLLENGVAPGRLWWLRLDHPILLGLPLDVLVRLIIEAAEAKQNHEVVLLLDELVYAKDWQLWLKTFYDDRWPVRILATSSATAALRNERRESGIGRWTEHYMLPYSFSEYLDLVGESSAEEVEPQVHLEATLRSMRMVPDINGPALAERRRKFLLVGGFPELLSVANMPVGSSASSDEGQLLRSQMVLRSDSVERAIYKDIPQSFGVSNPMVLERLLYALAGQFTGVLSPANVCKELEMSQPTFDKYLNLLEQAYLVFRLTNYSGSESTIQKRGRKLYFYDGAVRNAALQRGIGPLSNPQEMGMLQENLTSAALNSLGIQTEVRVHYWRDSSKREADLVYDHPTNPLAFELASSGSHPLAGLRAFQAAHPRFKNRCFLVAPDLPLSYPEQSSEGVGRISLDRFLIAVGRQAGAALRGRS